MITHRIKSEARVLVQVVSKIIGALLIMAVSFFILVPEAGHHTYYQGQDMKTLTITTSEKEKIPIIIPEPETTTFETTYYSAYCPTCGQWGGITKSGHDISDTITHDGMGIVAVDTNVIPLHSVLAIDGKTYIALDTGGDIKGKRIDILVWSTEEAYRKGRHDVEVEILH